MVRLVESPSPLLDTLRLLVPALTAERYKGQAGKIAVIGGCADYTGAPYYAAISGLKLGADLSHVFCSDAAATAIKSYSPELIVHGCLKERQPEAAAREAQVEAVCRWFPAITALVVGPGLGRDETLQAVAEGIIERAIAESIPCVIDADGLAVVVRRPALVHGSRWTVLTPNRPEYQRLSQAVIPQVAAAEPGKQAEAEHLAQLCEARGGPATLCAVVGAATLCTGCEARGGLLPEPGPRSQQSDAHGEMHLLNISSASPQPSWSLSLTLDHEPDPTPTLTPTLT